MESGVAAARGTVGASAAGGLGSALADPLPALASHPTPPARAQAIASRRDVRVEKVIVVGMYRARRAVHDWSLRVSCRGRSATRNAINPIPRAQRTRDNGHRS